MSALERLRARIAAHPPRTLALDEVAPRHVPEGRLRRAAVLVPLFQRDGEEHVLLTLRRIDLRQHAGQVSFPGGRVEPGEESLRAALREAEEEIGLAPSRVDVLGPLDDVLVLATGFCLTPWVALVPYPYPYAAHPGEVEAILNIPLAALAQPGVHRVEEHELYGERRMIHFYELPTVTVWGATARVLHQLLELWSAP